MRYKEWKTFKIKDVIDINPRTSLKKGTVAKKVAMENVKEFTRKIEGYEIAEFKSGSKFKNYDTLFARITPCLENGKTAYVDILDEDEVSFGSTEFYVLRAKEGKTDSRYVYYLSISEPFRNTAIQSMTGTSGRQRAQKESLLNYEIYLPSLKEQKIIGKTLSYFDKKIELNNSIIFNLEELAQTLFKHWFVNFEFPNENGEPYKSSGGKMVESELGMIPSKWSIGTISDLFKVRSGFAFKSSWWTESGDKIIKIKDIIDNSISLSDMSRVSQDKTVLAHEFEVRAGDLLIALTGATVGKIGLVPKSKEKLYVNQRVGKIFMKDHSIRGVGYIFGMLLQKEVIHKIIAQASGSAQANLSPSNIEKVKCVIPSKSIKNLFNKKISSAVIKITELRYENSVLTELRDTLLPKLLSGELELPDDMGVTEDVPIS